MMNKKNKNKLIFLLVFALVFFYALETFAAKPKKDVKVPVKKKETVAEPKEIKYTGHEAKRDPFNPPEQIAKILEKPEKILAMESIKPVEIPNVQLQGIIGSKNMPQAIISGSIMKVGEYIEDFQIQEISKDGVVLFLKGKEYLLKMQGYQSPKTQKRKK